ncbi:hypothetical protein [Corallococcus macrosporus]|uniref:Uncharacterized protein n=1 Tax=Myxococcus fulvus (strain ATCC BAA-855 / HW-1) TaxID=483219 RepID=F8CR35_MYXFH|nr:hypothetical protein [Corallococcus macrosporus]AEI63079.1 hypothetical protein LILAB_05790 [Corallococcus macrosporus]
MMDVDLWSEHVKWIDSLSTFLGCHLKSVQGSETIGVDAASATLEGVVGARHSGVVVELVVKLLVTRNEGDVSVWALVFFFVDGRRVAEEGKCCLAVEWREGQWSRRGWEADDTGEWVGLEVLE